MRGRESMILEHAMQHRSLTRSSSGILLGAFLCLAAAGPSLSDGSMAHMSGHMYMTSLRSPNAADLEKAAAVVSAAKAAMAPYQDYRKALEDGYKIFLPNIPQPQYHFTNYKYGLAAIWHFDPLKPTSLLYKKTADGYELVGVMYTARVGATEQDINERVPLSVARWHQHINFCKAPMGQKAGIFWVKREVRITGIHYHQGCMYGGGGRVLPTRARVDGACVPLRDGSWEHLVDE